MSEKTQKYSVARKLRNYIKERSNKFSHEHITLTFSELRKIMSVERDDERKSIKHYVNKLKQKPELAA